MRIRTPKEASAFIAAEPHLRPGAPFDHYLSYSAGRDGGEQRDAHYRQFHQWLVKKYAEYGKTGVYFL